MIKKTILLAMAVGAVAALVAPGAASATKLTMPSGTLVKVGERITGTANNTTIPLRTETEVFGTLGCEAYMFNDQVTKNNGTTAELVSTEGSTASGCAIEGEIPYSVEEMAAEFSSTEVGAETGTGKFSLKKTVTIPGGVVCKFNTGGQTGVFHFKVNTDILIITPTNISGGGCGNTTLTGEVTLETASPSSGPVTLS